MYELEPWTSEDVPSEYFNTCAGKLEFFVVCFLYGGMRKISPFAPMFWYGAENEMALYLIHPSYSPFVDHPRLGHPKRPLEWNMTKVPKGQENLVDENFIPNALKTMKGVDGET